MTYVVLMIKLIRRLWNWSKAAALGPEWIPDYRLRRYRHRSEVYGEDYKYSPMDWLKNYHND